MHPRADDNPTEVPSNDAAPGGDVVFLNRDLFFGVRVSNTLRELGYTVTVVPDAAAFAAKLRETIPAPLLGIIDISAGVEWSSIIGLTENDKRVPILAFGPHKDVEGLRSAKGAGVTRVVSNGDFHQHMVELVRRYSRPAGAAEAIP
ncbi:MAG: hypothetical protein M3R06_00910 [Chloroflexota bacterium]|nr:hypothetical protein [Chloroflexota bacterium]